MKILVVHPGSGWILSSIAIKLAQADPAHFTCVPVPSVGDPVVGFPEKIDGLFAIDMQNCWNPQWRSLYPGAVHIAAFTHADLDSVKSIRNTWHGDQGPDGVIHMALRYFEMFAVNSFYSPERMTVLRPGEVSHFPLKKTKIGICQRGEHVGKGRDFLPEVIKSLRPEVRDCIELHFKGKGWDDQFEHKAFRGATFFGGDKPEEWFSGSYHGVSAFSYASEDAKSYPGFYAMLDYYLVPSRWEGGGMGALEAFATGLPTISSDVGWMNEFGVEHLYEPGDVSGLAEILTAIASRRISRREKVSGMSYKKYAEGVLAFFDRLRGL